MPLLHLPISEVLLPGESRTLIIEDAEGLAALEAADNGCVGCLFVTPNSNALSTTTLLEIREMRKEAIGASVDVVGAGRLHMPDIQHCRFYEAQNVTTVCDVPSVGDSAGAADADLIVEMCQTVLAASDEAYDETAKLTNVRRSLEKAELRERTLQHRDELCVLHPDQAPAASLKRLHTFWGVEGEEAALEHLSSFVACEGLSAVQRSIALGMLNTDERLAYARRCHLKARKRQAAMLAIDNALPCAW